MELLGNYEFITRDRERDNPYPHKYIYVSSGDPNALVI